MKTLVLIAIAFTSSLFANTPIVEKTIEHIPVLKEQIVVIEDGLFVASHGQLLKASALFHTETGFVAKLSKDNMRAGFDDFYYECPHCGWQRGYYCRNPECPDYCGRR
ncbi:MAG: hypothetical protein JSR80_05160 [Verrucomicrobia bacterium]|nr:hypothetical protein [Verrucomicrobiota bacterium]